jgi:hypothetical protein
MVRRPARSLGNSFIEEVVGDPKSPRRTIVIKGYESASSRSDSTRLYLDLAFRSFVDVPASDVYGRRVQSLAGSPLDVTFLWVSELSDVKWMVQGGTRTALGASPALTEFGCPPQTIHTDCPTPTFNTAGCHNTELGCGQTDFGCGETELGCGGDSDFCDLRRGRRRQRRYW